MRHKGNGEAQAGMYRRFSGAGLFPDKETEERDCSSKAVRRRMCACVAADTPP